MPGYYQHIPSTWGTADPDHPPAEISFELPGPCQQWVVLSEDAAARIREGDTVALRIGPGGSAELLIGDGLLDDEDDTPEENA